MRKMLFFTDGRGNEGPSKGEQKFWLRFTRVREDGGMRCSEGRRDAGKKSGGSTSF